MAGVMGVKRLDRVKKIATFSIAFKAENDWASASNYSKMTRDSAPKVSTPRRHGFQPRHTVSRAIPRAHVVTSLGRDLREGPALQAGTWTCDGRHGQRLELTFIPWLIQSPRMPSKPCTCNNTRPEFSLTPW